MQIKVYTFNDSLLLQNSMKCLKHDNEETRSLVGFYAMYEEKSWGSLFAGREGRRFP